jgi:hypothetical protein
MERHSTHSTAASNAPVKQNDDEVMITELAIMEVSVTVKPTAEAPEAIQQCYEPTVSGETAPRTKG